jgi:hypothetical protein
MAQPWVTGVAHIFVRPPNLSLLQGFNNQAIGYLGTAKKWPQIALARYYHPVWNDLGGSKIPIDELWQGEDALVGAEVNRWNELVYEAIATIPLGGAGVTGSNGPAEMGTAMVFEGFTFDVWVAFPYSPALGWPTAKAAYLGMPPGYHFPACVNLGPDRLQPIGVGEERSTHLLFKAKRIYNPAAFSSGGATYSGSGVNFSSGGAAFTCYDFNFTGIVPALLN